ncbi:Protein of unknown function [Gryllus bimaculatus]|nr:Protein of unknown function [Gryllus bimaculatus]
MALSEPVTPRSSSSSEAQWYASPRGAENSSTSLELLVVAVITPANTSRTRLQNILKGLHQIVRWGCGGVLTLEQEEREAKAIHGGGLAGDWAGGGGGRSAGRATTDRWGRGDVGGAPYFTLPPPISKAHARTRSHARGRRAERLEPCSELPDV